MQIRDSSDYVIARAKLFAEYFSDRNWLVSAGKNNCILIYIASGERHDYTLLELAAIIGESDFHIPETGLKTSACTYIFSIREPLSKKLTYGLACLLMFGMSSKYG